MLLDGDEHLAHRRIMQQAFTRDRLSRYTEALHPAVEEGLDGWQPTPGFAAYPALKELTLDLATSIFMGGAEGSTPREMAEINKAFIDSVQAATSVVRYPPARNAVEARHRRARTTRGVLPPLPARAASGCRRRPVLRAVPHRIRRRATVQRRRRRQPHDLPADGGARHIHHHAVDDDAVPRSAPRLAGAVQAAVGGTGHVHPDLRSTRRTDRPRPRHEGMPAPRSAGPGGRPPRGRGHRGARPLHPPPGYVHVGGRALHPSHARVLARSGEVRPRTVRTRTPRGQGSPVRVGAVRRRRAQMPGGCTSREPKSRRSCTTCCGGSTGR